MKYKIICQILSALALSTVMVSLSAAEVRFTSKKNSVPDPQSEWLKKDLKEFFMDEFTSLSFKNSEMFNKKKIFKNLDLFHKNKLMSSFHLFQIFTYQKYKNHFNI